MILKQHYTLGKRASALLIVLWVIALLSFIIVTSLMVARQDIETTGARKVVFRARQLAEMGIAVGSHPGVKAGDAILRQHVSATESFETVITSEESRLNFNTLLTEEHRPLLERIFKHWGLSEPDAEILVDSLMDWTDGDSFKRLKGAENGEYRAAGFPERPFNRSFQSLDEAALVLGMDRLTEVRPDWREWFTLRGSGRLDVNKASAEMLSLITDTPLHIAQELVNLREGPDGIPDTEDDTLIQSIEEAMASLGVADASTLESILTVQSTTTRIESIGRVGDYARGIAVVLRNGGGAAPIQEWREFIVQ